MKFSCCIEMIYLEYDFLERIRKAKEDGFEYFEFWNWDNKDIPAIRRVMDETGMKLAAFQGNSEGRMCDALDADIYLEGVKKGIAVAKELRAENMFLMSDIMQEDRSVKPFDRPVTEEEKRQASLAMLKKVAGLVEEAGVTAVIEPLNTIVDHSGYSLCHTEPAVELLKEAGSPNIRLLYDAYHMQIMEGNICDTIKKYSSYFGHFHIADVPGRCEPGTGELNYTNILKTLKETGYERICGFECTPVGGSSSEVMRYLLKEYGEI